MSAKRWWALAIAAVLFFITIGFGIAKGVSTLEVGDPFSDSEPFTEVVIDEGTSGNKIAVVRLDGAIIDSGDSLLGGGYAHQEFLRKLDVVKNDPSIDALVLAVNSPGGGVVESAEIHDKVLAIKEAGKPVYASMGNMAASGGYYVSAPADKIIAHPATITGSIGVIMESYNVTELADKLGIDVTTIKSGKHKDIMSSTRKMTDEEHDILQSIVDDMYADFVKVVADGRELPVNEVKRLADGRVYTGKQAKAHKLVDELGTLEDSLQMIQDENDLKGAQIVELEPSANFNFWFTKFLGKVNSTNYELKALLEAVNSSDGPRAMYLYTR